MKHIIALAAAAALLFCTACGQTQNDAVGAAAGKQEITEIPATETAPAAEPAFSAVRTAAPEEKTVTALPETSAGTAAEQTEPLPADTAEPDRGASVPEPEQPAAGDAEIPRSILPPGLAPDAPQQTESTAPAAAAQTTAETALTTAVSGTTAAVSAAGSSVTTGSPASSAPSVTTAAAAVPSVPKEKQSVDTSALDRIVKQYSRGCAVELVSLDGTVLYSYRPNTRISGASLIKLPYVYYCCTQIEAGSARMTDTMTYNGSYTQGGSGILRNKPYGTKFTLAQLMEYALRYSDNTAYYMLVTKFGSAGFNQMVQEWGYTNISISVSGRFPALTAAFMADAMRKMYEKRDSGACWENAWLALVRSERSYARAVIGGTDEIAVKYGSIPDHYHETILVNCAQPYILVILSGAVNYNPDAKFVQNVVAAAKKTAEQYNAQ